MVNDVMNEQYIKKPHLPTADVTLVVMSARKPLLIEALKKLHIRIIPTEPLPMIRGEERYHADMSFCHIGNSEIVVADSLSEDTFRKLTQEGFHCQKSFEAITGEKSLLKVISDTLRGETFIAGDVNADGRISVLDATCIQKFVAEFKNGTGRTGQPVVFE